MSQKKNRRDFIQLGGIAAAIAALPRVSAASFGPVPQTDASASMGGRFRQLLGRNDPFECIAVYDDQSARLVNIAGFPSVFVGGTAAGIENGYPDWGLTSFTELIEYAARIVDQIDIPMLADADNGGGNPLTVYRTTRAFERAGVGAVMFEDRIRTERIGQTADVIPTGEMVDRIRAAVDARSEMVIVARSDALAAGRSEAEAFERGGAYAEAGAEALFLGGLPLAGNRRAADAIDVALMGPMGAGTPMSDAAEARVTIALCANFLQNIAQGAIYNALEELKTTGTMAETNEQNTLPREIDRQITRNDEILERAREYNVAPQE